MDGEVDEKLLAKYLAGECSEQEEIRVREWISHEADAANRMSRLMQVWEAAGASSSQWDAEAAWKGLRGRVRREADSSAGASGHRSQDRPARRSRSKSSRRHNARSGRRQLFRIVAVGAVVMALVAAAALLRESLPLGAPQEEAKVLVAEKGERTTAHLADGTRVWINADSRLTIFPGFNENQREVRLEGEAYFDVVRDAARPFVVRARNTSVEVLGTAFDVQAYPGETEMHVAVAEGEVALHVGQFENGDTVTVLQPRFWAMVSDEGLQSVDRDADLSRKLAWIEGKLVFDDAPFGEVVQRLERWYDIEVDVVVPFDEVMGLNATFGEEASLDNVLHDIAAALDLKYRREMDNVTFYR